MMLVYLFFFLVYLFNGDEVFQDYKTFIKRRRGKREERVK